MPADRNATRSAKPQDLFDKALSGSSVRKNSAGAFSCALLPATGINLPALTVTAIVAAARTMAPAIVTSVQRQLFCIISPFAIQQLDARGRCLVQDPPEISE